MKEEMAKMNKRFKTSDADAELLDRELGIKPQRNRLSQPKLYSVPQFKESPPRSKSDGEFLVKSSAAESKDLVPINLVSENNIIEYLDSLTDFVTNMKGFTEESVNEILICTMKFINDHPDKVGLWKFFLNKSPLGKTYMMIFQQMKNVLNLVDYPKLQSRQLFTIELRGIDCLDKLNIPPFLFEFFQLAYLAIQYIYLKNHNKNIQITDCEEALQQYGEQKSEISIDTSLTIMRNEILILANSLRVQSFLFHNNIYDDWSRFVLPDTQNKFSMCIGLLLDALKSKSNSDSIYFPFSISSEPLSEFSINTPVQTLSVLYFNIKLNEKKRYEIGVCNIIGAYLCHSQAVNDKITKPLHILDEFNLDDTEAFSRCLLELFTKKSPKFEQRSDRESLRRSQDALPFFNAQQMRFKILQPDSIQSSLVCNYFVAANLRLFNALRSEILSTNFLNFLCMGKFISIAQEGEPQQKRTKVIFGTNDE